MIYLPCFIIGSLTGLLGVDVLESILTTFYTCFADDPLALQKHDAELFSEFIEIWCARCLYTPTPRHALLQRQRRNLQCGDGYGGSRPFVTLVLRCASGAGLRPALHQRSLTLHG